MLLPGGHGSSGARAGCFPRPRFAEPFPCAAAAKMNKRPWGERRFLPPQQHWAQGCTEEAASSLQLKQARPCSPATRSAWATSTKPPRTTPEALGACVHPKSIVLAPTSRCATDQYVPCKEHAGLTPAPCCIPGSCSSVGLSCSRMWPHRAHVHEHLQQPLSPTPEDTEAPAQSCPAHPLALQLEVPGAAFPSRSSSRSFRTGRDVHPPALPRMDTVLPAAQQ